MTTSTHAHPRIASRAEWLAARKELLVKEKELTRARDALNAQRRGLPMVEIDKEYIFEGPDGRASLLDLFEGRRQLIVYHFMFHRDKGEGCEGCSFLVDNIGHLAHLHARDTTLVLVSRAPLAEIESFRKRMGWTIPWYSSFGSDFNYDYHATTDEAVAPVEYNYRDKATLEKLGHSYHIKGEQPGISVFLHDGDRVFHTYSTYGRGMGTWSSRPTTTSTCRRSAAARAGTGCRTSTRRECSGPSTTTSTSRRKRREADSRPGASE